MVWFGYFITTKDRKLGYGPRKNNDTIQYTTYTHYANFKMHCIGAGGVAQWLRTLAVRPEDLGVIPNNHMVAHNYL